MPSGIKVNYNWASPGFHRHRWSRTHWQRRGTRLLKLDMTNRVARSYSWLLKLPLRLFVFCLETSQLYQKISALLILTTFFFIVFYKITLLWVAQLYESAIKKTYRPFLNTLHNINFTCVECQTWHRWKYALYGCQQVRQEVSEKKLE